MCRVSLQGHEEVPKAGYKQVSTVHLSTNSHSQSSPSPRFTFHIIVEMAESGSTPADKSVQVKLVLLGEFRLL